MSQSLHAAVTEQYYQTTASRAHQGNAEHYRESAKGLLRRIRPWLPADRGARCLDLACGCGELMYLLEDLGYRQTTGVDLCHDELVQARDFVRGKLVHSDILEHLREAPDRSVDFITAFNILEHLPKDVLGGVLAEAARVLAPGGTLVAMVPNAISPFGGLTRHWDITHEWAFTPNNFRQLAAISGLSRQVEFRECGPVPHGLKSGVRYLLWQLIRGGIAAWFMVELADLKGGVYTMDMLVRMRAADERAGR